MIPAFLLRKPPELSEEEKKFGEAIKRYEEHFEKNDLMTATLSTKRATAYIEECLKKDMTFSELVGTVHDPDVEY